MRVDVVTVKKTIQLITTIVNDKTRTKKSSNRVRLEKCYELMVYYYRGISVFGTDTKKTKLMGRQLYFCQHSLLNVFKILR